MAQVAITSRPWNPSSDLFAGETTAKQDFTGVYMPKQKSYKPDVKPYSSGVPMDGTTTSKLDFPQHKQEARKIRQPQVYQKPEGKMEVDTINRLNYPPHELQPRQIYKPVNTGVTSTEPFDGETTARNAYPAHPLPPKKARERPQYVKSDVKMDGTSTSKSEFPKHDLPFRESYKPVNKYEKSDVIFGGESTSRTEFPKHTLEKIQRREQPVYVRPEGKMEGNTSSRMDFPPHELPLRMLYKPTNKFQKPEEPFSNTTVNMQEYGAHTIEPRRKRAPVVYVPPEGRMDGVSTNRSEYLEHKIPHTKSFKPSNAPIVCTDLFDDHTTSKMDFPKHPITMRTQREPIVYVPPEAKMDGISVNRSEYPKYELTPRQLVKAPHSTHQSDAAFDGRTTARDDYPAHIIELKKLRERPQYVRPEGSMDGVSTSKAEFPAHSLLPLKTYKPIPSVQASAVPFEDKTTSREDFPDYKVVLRPRRTVREYVKPDGIMETTSSSRVDFQKHDISPRIIYKPDNAAMKSEVPFDDMTTARQDYHAYQIQPRSRRAPREYVPPEGKMDGCTTARSDYHEHQITSRRSYKPMNAPLHSDEPFDDKTTARMDFPFHSIEPRQNIAPREYVPPEDKMEVHTTTRSAFQAQELSPRISYKPTNAPLHSEDVFDGRTTAHEDFTAHTVEPRQRQARREYVPPEGKMDGNTTSRAEYTEQELSPRKSYKPANVPLHSEVPFDGNTTARDDFQDYHITARKRNDPRVYVKPEGRMECVSTNRGDFYQHEITPRKDFRPRPPPLRSDDPFDGKTTSGSDFKQHTISPRQAIPLREYVKPEGRIEGNTTNRMAFTEHELSKTQSYKPSNAVVVYDVPFDGQTTTREAFTAHEINARPMKAPLEYAPPEEKMDCTTTNRSEFLPHDITPRQRFKPPYVPLRTDVPFENRTTARSDFPEHPIEQRTQKVHRKYITPEATMETNTTSSRDFQEHDITPQKSCKPNAVPLKSEYPFESKTVNSEDFTEHEITPRNPLERRVYTKPECKMETTTTNLLEFTEQELSPRSSIRPVDNIQRSELPFSDNTTATSDYVAHAVEPRSIHVPSKYVQQEDRMESSTTTGLDYHQHELVPTESFKPVNQPLKSDVPFDDVTTFREEYPEHPPSKRELMRTDTYLKPDGKFASRTTNIDTYTGEIAPKQKSFKPINVYCKPVVQFEASTTAKDDYPDYGIEPRLAILPKPYSKPEGIIDFSTVNQECFTAKTIQREPPVKPGSNDIFSGKGKFGGSTNYEADFSVPDAQPRALLRTPDTFVPPSVDMECTTTHKLAFTEPTLEPRKNCKPEPVPISNPPFVSESAYSEAFVMHDVKRREQKQRETYHNPDRFEGTTTTADSYKGVIGPKSSSYKPNNAPLHTEVRFDGWTTAKGDFKEHTVERRAVRLNNVYTKPDGNFDFNTTNKENFTGKETIRQTICKPKSSTILKSDGPFYGSTVYEADFKPRDLPPRVLAKMNNKYIRSITPMATSTTFCTAFTEHKLTPRKPFKPIDSFVRPLGRFTQFTGNKENIIPAERIRHDSDAAGAAGGDVAGDVAGDMNTNTNSNNCSSQQSTQCGPQPQRQESVPNPSPFLGLATHQSDLIKRDGMRATSFKLPPIPFSSNITLASSTTYSGYFNRVTPPWIKHIRRTVTLA